MYGMSVTCIDRCGALVFLQDLSLASIISEGNCSALADVLRECLRRESPSQEERKRIRDWSACISGSSVARSVLNVVSNIDAATTSPQAPWLVGGPSSVLMIGSDGPRSSDELRAAFNRAVELGQEDYDRMSGCARATAAGYSAGTIMKLQPTPYEELMSE